MGGGDGDSARKAGRQKQPQARRRRRRRIWLVLAGGVALAAAYWLTRSPFECVSVASDGTRGNDHSYWPSISADGRFVAFMSGASNLMLEDTNGVLDVFVYDRRTQTTERASVAPDGAEGNEASFEPCISADGRFVAFLSGASNLAPGDTNGCYDVFVRDRQMHTTERVNLSHEGRQGEGNCWSPSISADGRYVAFNSSASNLVPGDTNGEIDVLVRDRVLPKTERISLAAEGDEAMSPSISADGRYVAFTSYGDALPSPVPSVADVFMHDRITRQTVCVSVASEGTRGNGYSYSSSINADGRYVAFWSVAGNLVAEDTNGAWDVFVHDRHMRTAERVSLDPDGAATPGDRCEASISGDGRHVVFLSDCSRLWPGYRAFDVLMYDRRRRVTECVGVEFAGNPPSAWMGAPAISADG